MSAAVLFLFVTTLMLFAAVSRFLSARQITAPMVFAGVGVLCGPLVLGTIQLDIDNRSINQLAELALVVALYTDAARIDVRKLRHDSALPIRLLALGLPMTMLFGTLVALWLFPAFGLWEAAVLAVILGPTDAALGEPVVNAKAVPQKVRQGLNVESGLNDGLGLPALLIVASLATVDNAGARASGDWIIYVLEQLLGGPIVGLLVGLLSLRLLQGCQTRDLVSHTYARLALFVLPIAAYTGAEMVDANGFLAAFVSGVVVATGSPQVHGAVDDFSGAAGKLLEAAVFFFVGAVLMPQFLHDITAAHCLFALLALTLLRIVPVALSLVGASLRLPSVLFVGWFGPRGMASVIYLLIVLEDYRIPHSDDIAATVAVTVLLSIVLHGMSAAAGAQRYGAWVNALTDGAVEHEMSPVHRLRKRR